MLGDGAPAPTAARIIMQKDRTQETGILTLPTYSHKTSTNITLPYVIGSH